MFSIYRRPYIRARLLGWRVVEPLQREQDVQALRVRLLATQAASGASLNSIGALKSIEKNAYFSLSLAYFSIF